MRLLIGLYLILTGSSIFAQVEHLKRIEVTHEFDAEGYFLISNESFGALLVIPRLIGSTKEYPLELRFFDTDLKPVWKDTTNLERRFDIIGYYAQGPITYLLFQNINNAEQTKIVRVDPLNQEIRQFKPKRIANLEITEFEIVQKTAVFGGYIQDRPAVFTYDMESDKVRTLPSVYQKNSELVEVKVNSDSVTFNVIASKLTDEKDRTLLISTYDYDGNPIRNYELESLKDYQLLTGLSSSIKDKEQLVVGFYTASAGSYPSGFFVNHVDRTGKQTMKFYGFGEFDSFLNHTGKRAEKLKAKARDKENWRYKIDGLFKELIEVDERIIFSGEFYRPLSLSTLNYQRNKDRNRQLSGVNYSANPLSPSPVGRGGNLNNGVVAEIDYTHAFAFSLDFKGNILWEGSMDIDETAEGYLDHIGDFIPIEDDAYYAYYHDALLVASQINVKSDTAQYVGALQLPKETEELKFERSSYRGVTRWYDDKFLIHGLQHVKGKELRKVFFINAVSIGPNFVKDSNEDQ